MVCDTNMMSDDDDAVILVQSLSPIAGTTRRLRSQKYDKSRKVPRALQLSRQKCPTTNSPQTPPKPVEHSRGVFVVEKPSQNTTSSTTTPPPKRKLRSTPASPTTPTHPIPFNIHVSTDLPQSLTRIEESKVTTRSTRNLSKQNTITTNTPNWPITTTVTVTLEELVPDSPIPASNLPPPLPIHTTPATRSNSQISTGKGHKRKQLENSLNILESPQSDSSVSTVSPSTQSPSLMPLPPPIRRPRGRPPRRCGDDTTSLPVTPLPEPRSPSLPSADAKTPKLDMHHRLTVVVEALDDDTEPTTPAHLIPRTRRAHANAFLSDDITGSPNHIPSSPNLTPATSPWVSLPRIPSSALLTVDGLRVVGLPHEDGKFVNLSGVQNHVVTPSFRVIAEQPCTTPFHLPEEYVRWTESSLLQLYDTVEYELDSDDEEYFELQAKEEGSLSKYDLSQLIDLCEKETVHMNLIENPNNENLPFMIKDDDENIPTSPSLPPRTSPSPRLMSSVAALVPRPLWEIPQLALSPPYPRVEEVEEVALNLNGAPPSKDQGDGCGVCGSERGAMMLCHTCGARAHSMCCGVGVIQRAKPWLCDRCQSDPKICCGICETGSGIILPVDSPDNTFTWCHLTCAITLALTPPNPKATRHTTANTVTVSMEGNRIQIHSPNVANLRFGSSNNLCSFCGISKGVTLTCTFPSCHRYFHANCCLRSGAMKICGKEEEMVRTLISQRLCPVHLDMKMAISPINSILCLPLRRSRGFIKLLPGQHLQFVLSELCTTVGNLFKQRRMRGVPDSLWRYWVSKRLRHRHVSLTPKYKVGYERFQKQVRGQTTTATATTPIRQVPLLTAEELRSFKEIRASMERVRLLVDLVKKREKVKALMTQLRGSELAVSLGCDADVWNTFDGITSPLHIPKT